MKDWLGDENSIWRTIGAGNHASGTRERDDYYATDPVAVDKLLTVEQPHRTVWECACGGGHLSERLTARGYAVYSTDIKDRGYDQMNRVVDFLAQKTKPFSGAYDILTNPPYKYAKEFVQKALDLLPDGCRCFMFLKLTFLEGKARYTELFKKYPPCRIHVFSKRILCAKNGDFGKVQENGGSAVAYAWFVWEKGFQGKTTIGWI